MAHKKVYPDGDLATALAIVHSPRGSIRKAAQFLDCSHRTAKIKILEYQVKQQAKESSGEKIIPLHKQAEKHKDLLQISP